MMSPDEFDRLTAIDERAAELGRRSVDDMKKRIASHAKVEKWDDAWFCKACGTELPEHQPETCDICGADLFSLEPRWRHW